MKDASTLGKELGLTSQTVNTRARVLGIVPTEIKQEGQTGRPRRVFSPEQCDRIAAYGKAQTPTPDSDTDDEDEAIDRGAMTLRNTIATPLALQFQQMNSQLETLEDQAAQAIAQRIESMPRRIMLKASKRLAGYEALDLGAIVGVLGCQPLALPMKKIDPSLI